MPHPPTHLHPSRLVCTRGMGGEWGGGRNAKRLAHVPSGREYTRMLVSACMLASHDGTHVVVACNRSICMPICLKRMDKDRGTGPDRSGQGAGAPWKARRASSYLAKTGWSRGRRGRRRSAAGSGARMETARRRAPVGAAAIGSAPPAPAGFAACGPAWCLPCVAFPKVRGVEAPSRPLAPVLIPPLLPAVQCSWCARAEIGGMPRPCLCALQITVCRVAGSCAAA